MHNQSPRIVEPMKQRIGGRPGAQGRHMVRV
jgi:hypothetical protein